MCDLNQGLYVSKGHATRAHLTLLADNVGCHFGIL